jgi:hypothetical protein
VYVDFELRLTRDSFEEFVVSEFVFNFMGLRSLMLTLHVRRGHRHTYRGHIGVLADVQMDRRRLS